MQTTKELSKEIAAFSREIVHQPPTRRITRSGIGKAVLQGVMLALLAASASASSGNAQARSSPWLVGN